MSARLRSGPYLHTARPDAIAKSPRFIGGFLLGFVSPKVRTKPLSLKRWWRRGESNPRPKQLQPNIYARVPSFNLSTGNADGQAYPMASA